MTTAELTAELETRKLLPPAQAAALAEHERTRPFSIHYELRALLYFGITLLAGGLGVLIYQNIDHIGHGVVIGLIAVAMLGSFAYAARHRPPFTWGEAPRAGLLPDYALLLSCLLFLVLEGYLQYQYGIFGTRYGLATVLPALLFIGLAYAFDHRGVLSMGLTALGTWVGVTVAPLSAFSANNFFRYGLGETAIVLGVSFIVAGLISEYRGLKRHFAFTYLSLGSNVALLAATSALFSEESRLPAFALVLLIFGISGFLVWYARRTQSYLFLLLAVIYSYAVLTYLVFVRAHSDEFLIMFGLLYFIGSAAAAIVFFVNIKKILRIHAD